MDFQFNPAQLSRSQQNSLMDVLGVMQAENTNELVVTPVEFPNKFKVKLDEDVEMIIVWDGEKEVFAGLTEPEPTPEPVAKIEEPEPDKHKDIDPMKLALLKYELMSAHLIMSDEKKIIFAKEYSRLWSEHR